MLRVHVHVLNFTVHVNHCSAEDYMPSISCKTNILTTSGWTWSTALNQDSQQRWCSLPKLRDGRGDLDVLPPLQPLLAFNQVVYAVDH